MACPYCASAAHALTSHKAISNRRARTLLKLINEAIEAIDDVNPFTDVAIARLKSAKRDILEYVVL